MEETNNNPYYHYAFFSAFTTLPGFEKNSIFYSDEIEKIFQNYRQALQEIQSKACENDACDLPTDDLFLHQSIPYCLFGDFDIAVFSLIDDFSFATKKFKPTSGSAGYKYQINTGIIPLVDVYNEPNSKIKEFTEDAIPGFFNKTYFYPYTGIASIKLNSAMVVGLGQPFLKLYNFFLITILDEWVDRMKKKNKSFFYFLNENLGWNELTIYFFGSSLCEVQRLLFSIRQYRLRDIKNYLEDLLSKNGFRHDYIKSDILPIFDQIGSQTLLSSLIAKEKKEMEEKKIEEYTAKDFLESHPVIATAITYGFHIDLIGLSSKEKELKEKLKYDDQQFKVFQNEFSQLPCIRVGWKVKPGHELAANELLSTCFPGNSDSLNSQIRTGKYPFRLPNKIITIKDYLDFSSKFESKDPVEISRHIIKLRSHLRWEYLKVPLIEFNSELHYDYKLKDFQIQTPEIDKIRNQLRVNPIPYIYKGQIENLINNYNDGIADPLMYNYFIGLRMPLVKFLQERFLAGMPETLLARQRSDIDIKALITDAGKSPDEITRNVGPQNKMLVASVDTETISEFIQAWNKAYWNRYFHSYYFTEINDFNIEHHGGIQQLLFTYDVIYKLIAKRIYGKDSKYPFVNVQVNHIITSTPYFNSINFTHLFQPAIYACECVHEAANHIIQYLIEEKEFNQFDFLFNPRARYDKIDPEKALEFLNFEKGLHRKVNARENFEVLYLQEHFGINAIRQMVTDYATYLLGYTDPDSMGDKVSEYKVDADSVRIFYQCHWYLFLIRADLYYRELRHTGGWFFKQDDFMVLFIRFNLMLYLFLDYSKNDLEDLNKESPSVELKQLWESEKVNLIRFVVRLGDALREEFKEQLSNKGKPGAGFESFLEAIEKFILDKNWEALGIEDQENYKNAIKNNQQLIFGFHALFSTGQFKHNIIIRQSKDIEGYSFECNVSFYGLDENREIFLDPKGNLFSTSPESRKKIFEKNVAYIKSMWGLSHQIILKDY